MFLFHKCEPNDVNIIYLMLLIVHENINLSGGGGGGGGLVDISCYRFIISVD